MQKDNVRNKNGYLCYLDDIDEGVEGLINDYWLTEESDEEAFFYSVDNVAKKYSVSGAKLRAIINNLCEYYFFTSKVSCGCCDGAVSVSSRKRYKEALSGASLTCASCLEEKRLAYEKECNEQLLNYLEFSLEEKVYDYADLSYLDKVFLLSILSESFAGEGPLSFGAEGLSWSGFKSVDSEALSSLISKKAIKVVVPMGEEARMAYGRLRLGSSYRNAVEIFGKVKGIPQPGFYFNLPCGFDDVNDFLLTVNDDVVKGDIDIDDIKAIKCLVNDIRVEKLYLLIKYVGSEYRLNIKENIKLDALLRYVAETYPLDKIYYTMTRMSKDVIEYMHKEQVNRFACEHLFTSFFENYLSKVKAYGWELKIKKALPQELESSNLEAMITAIFLSGCLNWNELSATDVAERWVSGLNIVDLSS
ncbi:hypothetical protein Q8G38_11200 [Halomonas venusta]|uniref:hypothetical protein n=1 Tax=Vreelandella venusta TaxID=44935 RepID=UPI00295EC79D|nr:hypothetical protein [Halomonas venusta]MDW0359879.1 hypothetical protein [Halomonas venusta]